MTLHHPIRLFFILYFVFCIFLACEKATAPVMPAGTAISLQAEYVGVTEAWLRLTVKLPVDEGTVKLWRDERLLWEKPLTQVDSLVYDSTLAPAQRYSYRAQLWQQGEKLGESAAATITTMDTTSHDFQWEIVEFPSPFGSGALYDVAIINENDIWAVGEIYSDSAQPWLPYNAVHWDGSEWELKRIQFRYFCDQPGTFPAPASSILAFNENDILIAAGSQIAQWNGQSQDKIECIPVSVNKLWGTDKNNVYAVGALGKIAHYDGQRWQRIESGTELGLTDVWGVPGHEVYTVGLHYGQIRGVVLRIIDQNCQIMIEGFPTFQVDPEELFVTKIYGTTEGVWVDEKGTVYTVGNLMYQYKLGKWDYVRSLPENYPGGNPGNHYRGYLHAVRGNASNDIFIFGESNTIIHFNGISWKKIGPPYTPWSYHFWYGCDVKGDLIVGVGKSEENGRKARLIKIWR